MRFLTIGVAMVWLLLGSAALAQQRRVALVIGNSAYTHDIPKLTNPGNDARLVASTLASLGFELVGGGALLDQSAAQMRDAMHELGGKLGSDTVAVFYFSGHGVEYHGENYLVPVDATIRGAGDVDYALVSANFLLKQIAVSGGGMSMVILDACRSNPFGKGLRDIGAGGLATMQAPRGTLIAYATAPGTVALDGEGSNGPFASALATTMRRPGLGLFDMFNAVALQVDKQTHHEQQPWTSASPIEGTFYFTPPNGAAPAPAPAVAAPPVAMTTPSPPASATAPAPPASAVSADEAHARGDVAYNAKNYVEAMRWLRVAADQGHPGAMNYIGWLYDRGNGVPQDYAEAMRWYRQAADKGNAAAMSHIGALYDHGSGVRQDYVEAMRWYRQAADKGNTTAMHNIGLLYDDGRGVRRDYVEAMRWYRQAADKGNEMGMNGIAALYAKGHGVAKDCAAARPWFEKSAALGNEVAKRWLKQNDLCSWN